MIKNRGGKTLGHDPQSGVKILIVDNLAFKDLNKNNELDDYEDWRLPVQDRAEDLAGKLTIEDIAGLMLYSSHQSIPGAHQGWRSAKYGGLSFYESGAEPSDLSDEQIKFIEEDNLRHVLITNVKSSTVAASHIAFLSACPIQLYLLGFSFLLFNFLTFSGMVLLP